MDLTQRGAKRFMTNYRDHWLELSHGLMRVAVCVNCKEKLVSSTEGKKVAEAILEKHKEFWRSDINAPKGFEEFLILDTNSSEEKYLTKRKQAEQEQIDELDKQKEEHNQLMEQK